MRSLAFLSALPAAESRPLLDFLRGETSLYRAMLERRPELPEKAVLAPAPTVPHTTAPDGGFGTTDGGTIDADGGTDTNPRAEG